MIPIDPATLLLVGGTMYLAMPLTVRVLLHRRHARLNIDLWCLSGVLVSVSLLLFSLRGHASPWLTTQLANGTAYLAAAIKLGVLRLEARHDAQWPRLTAAALLCVALISLGEPGHPPQTQGRGSLMHGLWAWASAWAAWAVARDSGSRSAAMMGWLFAQMGAVLVVRGLLGLLFATGVVVGPPIEAGGLFAVTAASLLLTAVGVNIGYLGLALDRAADAARRQRESLDTLLESQRARDLAARTREALADERARTTRLLAHEVRQPLHNAAVALQSGIATLARSRDADEAARAIEQAQAVIRKVSAALDNTVAATTMLAAQGRISTADTDLQVLFDLCLADLPPEARGRVSIDHRADARSAQLEPSLVRLALRNLLMNATLYAPPHTPVVLRVLDSDDPLALVIEVADQGPGIAAGLRERLFDEGSRGAPATVPGYGLGLHVVRRVADLHGGSVEWRPNEPQGSVFRLTLPQGDPP